MTPVRVRARRGEGDRLRDEILAAVGALLDETNDESAVSIRAIAERVGVTPPSIYRHFADKDEMLNAVCAGVFVQLQEGIAVAVAVSGSPLDALERAARTYIEFGLAHPEHYRIVFMRQPVGKHGPMDRDEFLAGHAPAAFGGQALAGSQAFNALLELMRAVLATIPKRRRPDEFAATTTIWMAMHGIVALRITKPDFIWPTVDEQVVALLWPWRQAFA